MSYLKNYSRSSVERYLRYGNGQSYIVINDKPVKKSTTGNLSKDCIKILTEYRNVTLTHDEVRNKVLGSQNKMNKINITIENMLRQVKDPRTGKILDMAASLIPLLRAASCEVCAKYY